MSHMCITMIRLWALRIRKFFPGDISMLGGSIAVSAGLFITSCHVNTPAVVIYLRVLAGWVFGLGLACCAVTMCSVSGLSFLQGDELVGELSMMTAREI